MTKEELVDQIRTKRSYLCIGLDTDIDKIPKHLLELEDPIFEFNKAIVDATHDLCVAYKPNIAFYECLGANGWNSLEKTLEHIPEHIFTIADAKRGDIGNSSKYYAKTFFETYNFDSVTLAPYMGRDSIDPFLAYENKWAIILGVTSNESATDFQLTEVAGDESSRPLYKEVIDKASTWGSDQNTMFVTGATRPELLKEIREIVPNHFLLVPGVGSQGGDLKEVSEVGFNTECGLLVNSSRAILYASDGEDFAEKAREAAQVVQLQMKELLSASL
ncbi:MAG: orotidine-5'-phosphate decarboxylase [Bacteroidetes bacterium]|nr:MAG: orotidine-5'-phosphate decarboxylase [Bacteroidota bacterium]